jgi:hypothetical protein
MIDKGRQFLGLFHETNKLLIAPGGNTAANDNLQVQNQHYQDVTAHKQR